MIRWPKKDESLIGQLADLHHVNGYDKTRVEFRAVYIGAEGLGLTVRVNTVDVMGKEIVIIKKTNNLNLRIKRERGSPNRT